MTTFETMPNIDLELISLSQDLNYYKGAFQLSDAIADRLYLHVNSQAEIMMVLLPKIKNIQSRASKMSSVYLSYYNSQRVNTILEECQKCFQFSESFLRIKMHTSDFGVAL